MTWTDADIKEGMEVHGSDGVVVGTVADVFTDWQPPAGKKADPSGRIEAGSTGASYLRVDPSEPLQEGEEHLFIPFAEIEAISDGGIRLACSGEDARGRYAGLRVGPS
jgi:hypothetical protein